MSLLLNLHSNYNWLCGFFASWNKEMLAESYDDDHREDETQPQLLINHFTLKELVNVMARNTNKILALYEEISQRPWSL